ncbi:MAG: METTL5 family protein [Candidatus Bathyarchaeota archaeon]|nr:METTL5 family protein [Candidatus Bathyarchaeota archaeon]
MGEPAQRRLIRKLDLERFLSQVQPHPSPRASLEQYTTSESAAATMLYLAAYTYEDIVGKRLLDLGCGTGRLALAAAFLGAESVVGVDIDKTAVKAALSNSVSVGFRDKIEWVAGDIDAVSGKFDTVLQNPPFGVQKRNADRRFIKNALELGDAVYSLHNHPVFDKHLLGKLKANGGQPLRVSASQFMQRFVQKHGGQVEAVYALPLTVPHMFDFHTKTKKEIVVDMYIIKKKG